MPPAFLYTRTARPQRPTEWSPAKAIAFNVTLAATRTVTLAAREAGMSRKAAYALRRRDPAFAAAWDAAQGDKAERAAPTTSSTSPPSTKTPSPSWGGWRWGPAASAAERISGNADASRPPPRSSPASGQDVEAQLVPTRREA